MTDNNSIKEVLTFPFMKDVSEEKKGKTAAEVVGVEPRPEEGIRKFVLSRCEPQLILNQRINEQHQCIVARDA